MQLFLQVCTSNLRRCQHVQYMFLSSNTRCNICDPTARLVLSLYNASVALQVSYLQEICKHCDCTVQVLQLPTSNKRNVLKMEGVEGDRWFSPALWAHPR